MDELVQNTNRNKGITQCAGSIPFSDVNGLVEILMGLPLGPTYLTDRHGHSFTVADVFTTTTPQGTYSELVLHE